MSRHNRLAATAVAASYQPTVPSNRRRLDAAHKHLDHWFAQAESPQIGDRKFTGVIRVELTFRDGEASIVRVVTELIDSCNGGGM